MLAQQDYSTALYKIIMVLYRNSTYIKKKSLTESH